MFTLNDDILEITLPEHKTNGEIITLADAEINTIKPHLYGKDIKITGRITTHLAMFLGHELSHITHSVSLFDPKENKYFKVILH